jgi:hypothetical protein
MPPGSLVELKEPPMDLDMLGILVTTRYSSTVRRG